MLRQRFILLLLQRPTASTAGPELEPAFVDPICQLDVRHGNRSSPLGCEGRHGPTVMPARLAALVS